jgi:hypothetical protein
MLFKNYDKRTGVGSSQSQGKSEGWTEGLSKGLSHSISSSRTAGTSESVTTGTSETEGTTHGTSQSSTSGTSETIQKRALITSDEIGQVFARIDDKTQLGYPGLALVIISGARPLALIRVNYYEDYQFMGLFDPAPDFPFNAPKDLCVDGGQMGLSLPEFGLKVGAWTVTAGNIAASNDGAASIVTGEGKSAACIRVPRNGLVTTVQAGGADVPAGPLFSLRYYEDGAALIDPFAELRALCAAIAKQREDEKRKAAERKHRRKLVLVAAVACLGLLVVIVGVAHLTGGSASTPEIEPAPLAVSRSASVANVPLNQPGPTAPARSNSSISESAIMIGSVDVSHLLGIKAGDTIEQVDALYEPSVPEQDDRNRPRTYAGTALLVRFSSGRATGMTLNKTIPGPWKLPQSDMDNDPVFALYERSEADVIAVLGPPSSREAKSYADVLYWAFPNSDVKLDANGLPIQKVIIAEFATLAGSNKPARVVRLTINW